MRSRSWLVAQREYFENLRTKTFWVGILVVPVLLVLSVLVPIWLESIKTARQYAVVDRSGWLLAAVEARSQEKDLGEALSTALDLQRVAGTGWMKLPEPLRAVVEPLAAALPATDPVALASGSAAARSEREKRQQVVGALATLALGDARGEAELGESLPPEAVAKLAAVAPALGTWWQQATPVERAKAVPGLRRPQFVRVEAPGSDDAALEALNRQVDGEKLFGYFLLGESPESGSTPMRYVSRNLTDKELYDWFSGLANDVVREKRLASKQIDPEVARWVEKPLYFEAKRIGSGGAEQQVRAEDMLRQWAPLVFVYLLWISIFMTANMLMMNTIEEKSNRIMEVLLSSVSPLELLIGKILGIAATGLTVIGTWVLFFVTAVEVILAIVGDKMPIDLGSVARDPLLLGSFVVYFVLGYLFYASLLVGIGSVCNTLKEAQNLMTPITMLLMVPFFTMMSVSRDPNGTLAKVLSFIPPFTPFVMMNRAAGPPSLLEYVLTTALLIVATAGALWAAAKIFRIGILMTGKPPRLGELLRWLRAPIGQVQGGQIPATGATTPGGDAAAR